MEQLTFLQQAPLFSHLDSANLEQISADFRRRQFAPGDIIFHQGDPGRVLYLIKSGQVRIFVNGLEGTETSVILCGRPGEMFGELAIIDGLPRSATAVAMTDTVVYTLGRERFRRLMRQSPQLALNFMRLLTKKVRYNTRQMDSLASLAVAQRLARKLLELAQDYGQAEADGVHIAAPLTQSELASMIGATRERTNQVLRQFREAGSLMMRNGHIVIQDAEALRQLVSSRDRGP